MRVISAPSDGLNVPAAIASDGTHVWVANDLPGYNPVTELAAPTGALDRVISARLYKLDLADAIASDGTDVWVANGDCQSVTAFPAS